jgi:outer membrane immunogenic protein
MKLFVAAAGLLLISSPALAETTPWAGATAGININGGGVTVAGRAGVDTTIGKNAFIGIGLGAGKNGAKDCYDSYLTVGDRFCLKGQRELLAEARLGVETKGKTKIYGVLGYTSLGINGTYTYRGQTGVSPTSTLNGVSAGFGVETMIGSKAFLRSEFRFGNYESGVTTTSFTPTIGFKF